MEDSRGRKEDSNNKEKTKNCHRGHWRPSEDEKLKQLVHQFGPRNWNSIAENLRGRSGKSCRLRWFNQLDPKINKKPFTEEEGKRLLAAQKIHGNRWALISRLFPGRTDNAIKNHYHIIKAREQRSLTVLPYTSTISTPSTGTTSIIHNNNSNNHHHHPYSTFGRFLQRYYSKPNHNNAITPPTSTSTTRSSFMALPPNKRQRVPEEFSFFPSSMTSSKSGFMSNSSPQCCNTITTTTTSRAAATTAGTGSKVNNPTVFDCNVHGHDQGNIQLSSFDLQHKGYMLCKCNGTINAGGSNGNHDQQGHPPPSSSAAACNSTASGNKNLGSSPPGFKATVISTSIHDHRSDQEQHDADEEEYKRKDVPYINFF